MDPQTTGALLAGGFALVGSFGGVLISGSLARRADERRLAAEDERRWLTDRRASYSSYLGLAESMLKEIDSVAAFLSYDGEQPIADDDEELIVEGLADYLVKWDEALQPALGEVELLATPGVADLAGRVSGALLELTSYVETRRAFTEYYPSWFQAQDLVEVLKNAMRVELGVSATLRDATLGRRSAEWPWLPDRPPREAYFQGHSRHDSPRPSGSP
ncbi:hypothetical protein [Streptomyces sp. SID4985]|uniref:hypothetical protein n=1 Tax=Streptomyces sp. SID4985 TaxID=2690292 RepID=UPI0013683612|nr:hypothetical protein [Streptomyces sp. SID4985]